MGWSPAQVGALENCGIKVEDATGDIQWREFETIDIIKPDPIQITQIKYSIRSNPFTRLSESRKYI